MKAMVFAAGLGERLRPLTAELPKALVPVAGRAMIEYPLLLLKRHGITEIVINVHYRGEKIEQDLGDGKRLGLKISYSRENELLDTGGGLLAAKRFFQDDAFMVVNGDVLIDLDVPRLLAAHRRRRAAATLVLRHDLQARKYGAIETSADLKIRRFLGREAPGTPATDALSLYMFTGVQVLEPTIFRHMEREETSKFSITRATYVKMVQEGADLYGFPYDGYWKDLGTPERIAEAEADITSGAFKPGYFE